MQRQAAAVVRCQVRGLLASGLLLVLRAVVLRCCNNGRDETIVGEKHKKRRPASTQASVPPFNHKPLATALQSRRLHETTFQWPCMRRSFTAS